MDCPRCSNKNNDKLYYVLDWNEEVCYNCRERHYYTCTEEGQEDEIIANIIIFLLSTAFFIVTVIVGIMVFIGVLRYLVRLVL